MIRLLIFAVIGFMLLSCQDKEGTEKVPAENWNKRRITQQLSDSLANGETYLSVYSEIYSISEHRTYSLTVTVSMRNPSATDTIYVNKADFYNSKGDLLKNYITNPIYVAPMETLDIVIGEKDNRGGTGANFIFNWQSQPDAPEPIFEGVMISTKGQQGLSFSTQGVRVK